MEVTLLGTSSAIPVPGRNLSGTVLVLDQEYVLFDCGEGTQFSIRKIQLHPSKIKTICITHLHGDHSFGLPGLLSGINYSNKSDHLTVIGPKGLKEILDVSQKHQQFFADFPFSVIELDFIETPEVVYETGKFQISAVSLDHRIPAFGYRFSEKPGSGQLNAELAGKLGVPKGPLLGDLKEGKPVRLPDGRVIHPSEVVGEPRKPRSFAYITDTRFCSRSVLLAANTDLLMHEATYLADLAMKADETGHSTALDAGKVAALAGVRELVLFHYSARYTDLSPLLREASGEFGTVSLGHDFKTLKIG